MQSSTSPDITTIDETALLAAAREGDRIAFGDIVKTYQRRAYAIAYSYVNNRDDALELAQDAFIRAYRAIDRFDTNQAFYPWLYRIVRNTCLNHLKRKKRRGESSLDALMEQGFDTQDEHNNPIINLQTEDTHRIVHAALAKLNTEQQEILRLRHFLELSYSEIAECLEIPQGTVMSRLHTARKALKMVLERMSCNENTTD